MNADPVGLDSYVAVTVRFVPIFIMGIYSALEKKSAFGSNLFLKRFFLKSQRSSKTNINCRIL